MRCAQKSSSTLASHGNIICLRATSPMSDINPPTGTGIIVHRVPLPTGSHGSAIITLSLYSIRIKSRLSVTIIAGRRLDSASNHQIKFEFHRFVCSNTSISNCRQFQVESAAVRFGLSLHFATTWRLNSQSSPHLSNRLQSPRSRRLSTPRFACMITLTRRSMALIGNVPLCRSSTVFRITSIKTASIISSSAARSSIGRYQMCLLRPQRINVDHGPCVTPNAAFLC